MNFVDETLVRLAMGATRGLLFDQGALEDLLSAGYDATGMGLAGPYQPTFDEMRFGVSPAAAPRLEGTLQQVGRNETTELRVTISGFGGDSVRIDALWKGSIVARMAAADAPITRVEGRWGDLDLASLDAEIATALGALPPEPRLEQERRARLLTRLRQGLPHPGEVSDATLSRWLEAQNADSVAALVGVHGARVMTQGLTLTFAPPAAAVATPRALPVTVALLIRDAGASIADLIGESSRIRDRLQSLGAGRPRNGAGMRRGVLVGWLMPIAVLDDGAWPGGTRETRRTAANEWLGTEGVALIPVS